VRDEQLRDFDRFQLEGHRIDLRSADARAGRQQRSHDLGSVLPNRGAQRRPAQVAVLEHGVGVCSLRAQHLNTRQDESTQ
jgi:hypothetical protein